MGDWIQHHALVVCPNERVALAVYVDLELEAYARELDGGAGLRFGFVSPRLLGVSMTRKWGVEVSLMIDLAERFPVDLVYGWGELHEVQGQLGDLEPEFAFLGTADEKLYEALRGGVPEREIGGARVLELEPAIAEPILEKRPLFLPPRIRNQLRDHDASATVGLYCPSHGLVAVAECMGNAVAFDPLATPMFATRAGGSAWPISNTLDHRSLLPLCPRAQATERHVFRHDASAIWLPAVRKRELVESAFNASEVDELCAALALVRRWCLRGYEERVEALANHDDRHVAEAARLVESKQRPDLVFARAVSRVRKTTPPPAVADTPETLAAVFAADDVTGEQPRRSPSPIESAVSRLLRTQPVPLPLVRELVGHPHPDVSTLSVLILAENGTQDDCVRAQTWLHDRRLGPSARWLIARRAERSEARRILTAAFAFDPLAAVLELSWDDTPWLCERLAEMAYAVSGATYWAFTLGAKRFDLPPSTWSAAIRDDLGDALGAMHLLANAPSLARLGNMSLHSERLRWDGDPSSRADQIELWCEAALRSAVRNDLVCTTVAFANALEAAYDNGAWRAPPPGWIAAAVLHPEDLLDDCEDSVEEMIAQYEALGSLAFSQPDAPSPDAKEIIDRSRVLLELLGPRLPCSPVSDHGCRHLCMKSWTANALAWELTVAGLHAEALQQVEVAVGLEPSPAIVDTKIRALLGLGRDQEAYRLVRWLGTRWPESGVVADLEASAAYQSWWAATAS